MTSFRTDDLTRWGSGLGRNLTPTEVDLNFWDAIQRLVYLEAQPGASPIITHFSVDGTSFYVHFDNAVIMGPYELPVAMFRIREIGWVPGEFYEEMDAFNHNGILYTVLVDHTSEATFDPGANDGAGHDYYYALLAPPGNSLPTGGAAGMHLVKSTSENYAVTWAWSYPETGSASQYLRRVSSTQDDVEFANIDAAEVEFTPSTDSTLTSDNVADALEELAAGGGGAAADITYTPPVDSELTSDNVQDAIDELETLFDPAEATGSFEQNPTGNVSTTAKAMGLGGSPTSFVLTPAGSGIALVWIGGMATNTTAAGSGVTITGRWGTGTPPVNGATTGLGTQFGTPQRFVASTTAGQQGFIVMGKVTGMTVGTQYWFDISIVAVTSGGATVKDVQFVALEV
jgi:hypothetical protein